MTTVTVLQMTGTTSMHVLGKDTKFEYSGPGATAMFVADCVHSSCPPPVGSKCVKLVASWVECGNSSGKAASLLVSACSHLSTGGAYEVTSVVFQALQSVDCATTAMTNAAKYLMLAASMAVAMLGTTGTQVFVPCCELTLARAGSQRELGTYHSERAGRRDAKPVLQNPRLCNDQDSGCAKDPQSGRDEARSDIPGVAGNRLRFVFELPY